MHKKSHCRQAVSVACGVDEKVIGKCDGKADLKKTQRRHGPHLNKVAVAEQALCTIMAVG